jgi:hypothetical protein
VTVFFIVMDVAKRDEIIRRVFAPILVVLQMMQFEHLSWVVG